MKLNLSDGGVAPCLQQVEPASPVVGECLVTEQPANTAMRMCVCAAVGASERGALFLNSTSLAFR